ncbi:MAG: ATP-dependent DNA ligase [Gemmatimonadota bacterium]
MKLALLVETSRRVAATSGRLEKTGVLAEFFSQLPPDQIEIAVSFLTGTLRQSRLGIGPSTIHGSMPERATESPLLTLDQVDATFESLTGISGKGSAGERARVLSALLSQASRDEQQFLAGLMAGEVRQGALDGVVMEAVARAAEVPADLVRRAAMTTGDLPLVARTALTGGSTALAQYAVELFRPVLPMLAETAADVADAIGQLGRAALEFKFDGARVQVHKRGDEVRVFSRRLNDVTAAVPELVETALRLPAREIILDGEAIALRPNGSPYPFQVTMRRFGRKLDIEGLRSELPLASFFFDILWIDGTPLLDEPLKARVKVLEELVPPDLLVPRLITDSIDDAQAFLDSALAHGHEGIMAKALESPYEAGRRGSRWLKLKPAHTLDLVVLAAEWGHGRRRGWLSNLHLGARDPAGNGFVMLGKTFKGLTDETLVWQTRQLLALETNRDAHTVYVRPELVVEVAFNDVQVSPQYPGKLALRFARVRGYRDDKTAAEADTLTSVQDIYRRATGEEPPVPV